MTTKNSYTIKTINENGLIGELFIPQGKGPFKAIMCIGGSSGGVKSAEAPLFAEAGFIAFSLGYFGVPGLPQEFVNLPLEYFVKGVQWLLDQPIVMGNKIGLTGRSRGSEAVLQLATLTSSISAVAAYVPSCIRWMGINGQPSWTYQSKPLPYLKWPNEFDDTNNARSKTSRFNKVIDNPNTISDAQIKVEKANCPILLISGKDDQLWPSERMANMIIERLKKHNYPYVYQHISYPNAGHRIKVPGLNSSSYEPISEDTITHEILQLGGTYDGNKSASEKSWIEVLKFFRTNT